jgi:hypothetical protein
MVPKDFHTYLITPLKGLNKGYVSLLRYGGQRGGKANL